jgi:hypothetical protein
MSHTQYSLQNFLISKKIIIVIKKRRIKICINHEFNVFFLLLSHTSFCNRINQQMINLYSRFYIFSKKKITTFFIVVDINKTTCTATPLHFLVSILAKKILNTRKLCRHKSLFICVPKEKLAIKITENFSFYSHNFALLFFFISLALVTKLIVQSSENRQYKTVMHPIIVCIRFATVLGDLS